MKAELPETLTRACCRETSGSSMVMWQEALRPRIVSPGLRSISCKRKRRRKRGTVDTQCARKRLPRPEALVKRPGGRTPTCAGIADERGGAERRQPRWDLATRQRSCAASCRGNPRDAVLCPPHDWRGSRPDRGGRPRSRPSPNPAGGCSCSERRRPGARVRASDAIGRVVRTGTCAGGRPSSSKWTSRPAPCDSARAGGQHRHPGREHRGSGTDGAAATTG
jgi:hypothetical protein